MYQAMIQWDMIQEGDRLLLGLSGGKDSLSLLHCLLEFQKKLPIKFDIEVIHAVFCVDLVVDVKHLIICAHLHVSINRSAQ